MSEELRELRSHRQHLETAAQFWQRVVSGAFGNIGAQTVQDGMLAEIEKLVQENIELRRDGSTERCRTCQQLEHTWNTISKNRAAHQTTESK